MCARKGYDMQRASVTVLMCLAVVLAACTRAELVPHNLTPTPVPELLITRVVPTFDPAWLPTPTATPASTPVPPTPTAPPSLTHTPTPTLTRVAATLTPAPTGLLSVQAYVAQCRLVPTPDKPGSIVVQLSIEAAGGDGRYRYFVQGREFSDKLVDVAWSLGARLIVSYTVTAGDGQSITRVFNASPGELNCR